MRIRVDTDKCEGHKRGYALAPDLLDVDDHGYAREINEALVPLGAEERAQLAASNCPEYAIIIDGNP